MPDLSRYLEDRTLIMLSNREPYEHSLRGQEIAIRQPAGGLVVGLEAHVRSACAVAAPLPPRKPCHSGQICPTTAIAAAA